MGTGFTLHIQRRWRKFEKSLQKVCSSLVFCFSLLTNGFMVFINSSYYYPFLSLLLCRLFTMPSFFVIPGHYPDAAEKGLL